MIEFQEKICKKIISAFSAARIDAYRHHSIPEGDLDAIVNHLWNITLSGSLYPPLQTVEIILRNSMDNAIKQKYGNYWFNNLDLLDVKEFSIITQVKDKISKTRRVIEHNHIVSELNFGFWTSLLDKRYEQKLWPFLLKDIFPYISKNYRTRKFISTKMHKVRHLRNRIFHHQRIWHWHDLPQQHLEMLEIIGWIEPMVKEFIMLIDNFADIFTMGRDFYKKQFELFLTDQVKKTK